MGQSYKYILNGLRKVFLKTFKVKALEKPKCELDGEVASKIIYDLISSGQPSMIARFGATELALMVNYLGVKKADKNIVKYITGKSGPWWWEEQRIKQMQEWSGFFPPTEEKSLEFCELMMDDINEVDILGSWVANEHHFINEMNAKLVHLRLLEPFWADSPWTAALAGKKILVVHPFSETIIRQYEKRDKLFKNNSYLPEFKSLHTIKAVQTLGENNTEFKDWFEALQWMKDEIDKHDYDVCLIGAGAYGFPLAAHVKRSGKVGFHMGGALQLMFGIRGKRWEDPNYGVKEWGIEEGAYSSLINEYWTRPNESEKPKTANQVEGACYW